MIRLGFGLWGAIMFVVVCLPFVHDTAALFDRIAGMIP